MSTEQQFNSGTEDYNRDILARARAALEEQPQQIGPYRILERIGGGGMGEVYRAEQRTPIRREVALKLIKLGMDTKLVIARFEAERQALAMMDHPHIAKVFDAGAEDTGRPYFIMEYVKGRPITDYADQNHLTIAERLELFQQVCHAIQHAHHKGVIHRDLKPSNVLVSTQDGRPFAKVIDFGIAKATAQRLTEKTLYTQHEQLLGTPQYMSPEQAEGTVDIDTRTDVYSLGVLLYELLTGSTPFDGNDMQAGAIEHIKKLIREVDPPKPSTRISMSGNTLSTLAASRRTEPKKLGLLVRGELDWIVMKSLEKDRARRYDTPTSLAEDVQRYLAGEPVVAAPPSWGYRAKKFARRYKGPLAAGILVATILIAAIVAVSALAIQLNDKVKETRQALTDAKVARDAESVQRQEAERQRQAADSAAKRAKYESARTQAQYLMDQKLLDQALVQAKEAYNLNGGWEDGLLISRIVNACRNSWDLEHVIAVTERPLAAAIATSSDGQFLIVSTGSSLAEYDLATGKLVKQTSVAKPVTRIACFSGVSDRIVSIRQHGISTFMLSDLSPGPVQDFGDDEVIASDTGVQSLALTFVSKNIKVYDRDLNVLGTKAWPADQKVLNNGRLTKVAISPDGFTVIASGKAELDNRLIWDRRSETTKLKQLSWTSAIQFVDDATLFALDGNNVRIWKLGGDVDTLPTTGHSFGNFPRDDMGETRGFATTKTVTSFGNSVVTGQFGVGSIMFVLNPDIKTDEAQVERYASILGWSNSQPIYLCLSSDGRRLVLLDRQKLLVLERQSGNQNSWTSDAVMGSKAAFDFGIFGEVKDGKYMPYLNLKITPVDPTLLPHRQLLPLPVATEKNTATWPRGAAISDDQRTLAVRFGTYNYVDRVWNNHVVVIYHDLNWQADGTFDGKTTAIRLLTQDRDAINAAISTSSRILELSPDGKYVLVGTRADAESVAELYETATGNQVNVWSAGDQLDLSVRTVPKSNCFADIAPDGKAIRFFQWSTGTVSRQISFPEPVVSFCASSDGSQIIVSFRNKRIEMYDSTSGEKVGQLDSDLLPLAWSGQNEDFVGFSSDTGSSTGSIVLADRATGSIRAILSKFRFVREQAAKFSDDGTGLMYGGNLMRRLLPEMADRRLAMAYHSNATAGAVATVLPKIIEQPVAETAATNEVIDADDQKRLHQMLNSQASVAATVRALTPTQTGSQLVIGVNDDFSLFIPYTAVPTFKQKYGPELTGGLIGKRVIAHGTIIRFRDALEIKLNDVSQLEILDSNSSLVPGGGTSSPAGVAGGEQPKANPSADNSAEAGKSESK